MTDYDDFSDNQIKHLEMIQAVVARLGNNAFLIKGWAITIAGAFLAFAVNREKWALAVAAIAPTVLFWVLDASFLRNERLFRDLYDRVRRGLEEPFFMGATAPKYVKRVKQEAKERKREDNIASVPQTFLREALCLFYGAIIVASLVVAAIICHSQHT